MCPTPVFLALLSFLLVDVALAQAPQQRTAPQTDASAVSLIERGSKAEWRYLDDGTQPAVAWTSGDFPDAAWKKGRSPLGYGERGLSTEISYGGNPDARHLAAYFRRNFDFAGDPARIKQLAVEMRVDDGVVVYLNGQVLVWENIPTGAPTVRTRAIQRVEGDDEAVNRRYVVPATALKPGRNVLAAEVHQFNAVSSDLFFDLHLTASEELPVVRVAAAAREATLAYRKNHYVPAGMRLPDGYVDGGRASKIAEDGTVTSRRELIVVDRARDAKLRQHLDYVRWLMRANVPPLERAALIAQYVDQQYSPVDGRQFAEEACSSLLEPYAGREMLLGQATRAGVCRHRAVVFKLLADEAGLSVALVRGNLGRDGPHAWNELTVTKGEKLLVDVMNPRPGFRFPRTTDAAAAQNYFTVKNEPYYAKASQGTN